MGNAGHLARRAVPFFGDRVALLDPLALASSVGQQRGLLTPRCELSRMKKESVGIEPNSGEGTFGVISPHSRGQRRRFPNGAHHGPIQRP